MTASRTSRLYWKQVESADTVGAVALFGSYKRSSLYPAGETMAIVVELADRGVAAARRIMYPQPLAIEILKAGDPLICYVF